MLLQLDAKVPSPVLSSVMKTQVHPVKFNGPDKIHFIPISSARAFRIVVLLRKLKNGHAIEDIATSIDKNETSGRSVDT